MHEIFAKWGDEMNIKNHIFISYSSKELDVALKVCEFLENNDFKCWIAPRNVEAGGNFATQIVTAIKNCDMLVLLASENTNDSGHVSNEVSIAFDNKKIIVPFKIQDFVFTDEFLYFLGRKHWIEAHNDINSGLKTLLDTINSFEDKGKKTVAQAVEPAVVEEKTERKANYTSPQGNHYTRIDIVEIIIDKSLKYPYNLYKKIQTDEEYEFVLANARNMFKETVTVYKYKQALDTSGDCVDLLVNEMSSESNACVQVQGLPGGAKNMILQLAFYKMLENFKLGKSNALPFYVSASYYEKLPYNNSNIQEQMTEILKKEFREYFEYLNNHADVKPILFIEAIREHNVAKISPENIVLSLWKPFRNFSRVCAIDKGLIKNRSKLKRIMPILGDGKGLTFVLNQVPAEDKRASIAIIDSVINIYNYELGAEEIYSCIKALKFPVIDIFIVRLIAKEILSSYRVSDVILTNVYEKLALSETYGDEDKLVEISRELYNYIFMQSGIGNGDEYNGTMWSLPHKHNTYLEFLIAYYFVYRIRNYQDFEEQNFFGTMLTATANHFLVSFLRDDYELQETFLNFVKENYEVFDVRQKSNAVYWLGRITFSNLANEAVTMLTREFAKYKPLVKTNNHFDQENCDNHFLFRAICTGLLFQGQANMMDEYLSVVVANDVANAINRGATIEYFGDDYQMAAHDAYYFDTDLSAGEQAIRVLNSRIEASLYNNTGKFVENNLICMLTLLQARTQHKKGAVKFNVTHYVNKALEYLKVYQTRPQNVVSGKLMYYFQSIEEDFEQYLQDESFDVSTRLYNQYKDLKRVKRQQWLSAGVDDSESVSEHSYGAWLMAMFFLPEAHNVEGYSKKEILDMLLVHDMAEAAVGDQVTSLLESKKELKEQNDILRKLFLKGTYPDVANMTYYYNIWTGYYNGINVNARIARDVNLVQTVYTFCEYYCKAPEKFAIEQVRFWLNEKSGLKTDVGHQLFERLICDNIEFKSVLEAANSDECSIDKQTKRAMPSGRRVVPANVDGIVESAPEKVDLQTERNEYRVMSYNDIMSNEGDIESIKSEIIDIVYSVVSPENNAGLKGNLELLENISESWRVILNKNGDLVGYWVFVALQSKYFDRAKAGVLNEAEINLDTIEFIDFPGTYKGYLLLSGTKPEARTAVLVQQLYESMALHFEHLASKGIFFDEICAVAESPMGISAMKKLGMKEIGVHEYGGKVFACSLSNIDENRYFSSFTGLKSLYQEYFGN